MNSKSIGLFMLVVALISLGLFVNSLFFLVAMVSLCGGHMLLGHNHGKEHAHEATCEESRKENQT